MSVNMEGCMYIPFITAYHTFQSSVVLAQYTDCLRMPL